MRILHVHTRYRQPGGEDGVVAAERRLLSDAGHEVIAVDFENPSEPSQAALALVRAPWNGPAADRVVSRVSETRPDLVHVHNTWFSLSPAVFPKVSTLGVPVVATFHNYRLVCVNAILFRDGHPCEDCVGRGPWPGVQHGCYRGSRVASAAVAATIQLHRTKSTWSNQISRAIALTGFAKQRLEAGGVPKDRISIIPNFVADPGPRSHPASASDEVLFVGRLAPEKGVDLLLEAWGKVQGSGLRLVLIGEGAQSEKVTSKTSSSLSLLGRLEPIAVRERMLDARAIIVPSVWYEVQPLVILEALAAGLPIIYSDLGAMAETTGAGGVGFSAGDVDQLVGRLSGLQDSALVDDLSLRGRGEFERRFTSEVARGIREALYEAVTRSAVG